MRNIIFIILLTISTLSFAKEPNNLLIGIRNTNFAFIGYENKHHWNVRFENSLFAKQFAWQYARIYGGYSKNLEKIGIDAVVEPYIGTNYSGQFFDIGIRAGISKNLGKRLELTAEIIPLYDSGKGYSTCYNSSASYNILDEIALKLKYTNFPEYRNPEQRIGIGLAFNSGNLQINPEITIPVEGDIRTSRINIFFQYNLRLQK